MTRRRDAPIDSRMPISRWRATPRASSRLATFAHADQQDQAEGEEERHEHQHGLGRLRDRAELRFEHEVRGGPLDPAFSRTPRVPRE